MLVMWIYLLLLAVCTWATWMGTLALYRLLFLRKRPELQEDNIPPVSVLKPLRGVDHGLEANLESLFQQDYPNFELLFGIEGEEDPAVAVVRKLMDRYSQVQSRLIIHQGGRGFNPKVSNIRAILETGSHDILVINDSNIAVPTDYLSRMVPHLLAENVGLVTSLFVGSGEKNIPALLENMHLNGPVLNSLAVYETLMNEVLVVGKSNMFRRSVFDSLGGFESLAYVQAEDYFMGKMMKRAGYDVAFCTQLVHNINQHNTFRGLWGRYLRWAIARSHSVPQLYPFEVLINPFFLAIVGPFFGVPLVWTLPWMLLLLWSRDVSQWYVLRGTHNLLWVALLTPFREVLLSVVWLCAPFWNIISWRGHQFHVGEGAHLFRKTQIDSSHSSSPSQRPHQNQNIPSRSSTPSQLNVKKAW